MTDGLEPKNYTYNSGFGRKQKFGPTAYARFDERNLILGYLNGIAIFDMPSQSVMWQREIVTEDRFEIKALRRYGNSLIYVGWGGWEDWIGNENARNIYIIDVVEL